MIKISIVFLTTIFMLSTYADSTTPALLSSENVMVTVLASNELKNEKAAEQQLELLSLDSVNLEIIGGGIAKVTLSYGSPRGAPCTVIALVSEQDSKSAIITDINTICALN